MTKKNNNYLKHDKVFEKRSKNKNLDDFGFEIEKPKKQIQIKTKKILNNQQEEEVIEQKLKQYSLGENLFWKVWKNKYLKSVILNSLKTELKVGVYSYDEIVSVQWLLQNNYIELLKYKAKRGDLLVDFFDFKVYKESKNKKPKNLYKQVKNDFQLYKDLFKNYPMYFTQHYYKYICNKNHMVDPIKFGLHFPSYIKEYTKRESIINDNVAPFSLLDYENVDLFYIAIDFGSVDIAKYLFNTKLKSQKNAINGKVWKNHTFTNTTSNQNPKDFNIINKIVKLLIIDLKLIPPKEMNKISQDIFHVDIKSLTVSELYQCCFTIALLLEQTQFFKDYQLQISKGTIIDKYMDYTGYLQNYLPNPSIDFLSTTQINEMKSTHNLNQTDQLTSKVISISKDDENVYKLIKMLLPFTNYSNSYKNNFFYFNFKYSNNGLLNFKIVKKVDISTSEEENKTNTAGISLIILKDFKFGDSIENVIFGNQEFINSKIDSFNSFEHFQEFTNNPIIIKPKNLMTILLELNRLDLIIQTLDNLLNEIPKEKLFPVGLLNHIKSIEIFDYLLNIKSLKDEFSFRNCIENDKGLNNIMEHIKTNHFGLYLEFLNSIDPISKTPINYSFTSLKFIYKNIKDFHNFYERIDIWTRWNYFSLSMDDFIELVKFTPINQKYSYHCGILGNGDLALKRLHWVKKYRSFDLSSGRCDREYGNKLGIDTETTIHIYDYLFGDMNKLMTFQIPMALNNNYDHLINVTADKFFSKVFNLIGSRGDIKALEIIMEILQGKPIVNNLYYNFLYDSVLTPIIVGAVKNCKFNVFDFLKVNYPWIFDDTLINTQELEDGQFKRYLNVSALLSTANQASSENITFMQLLSSNYFKEIITRKKLY
ncbi:hypothetical protein ACTFIY_000438 [Dictyostelium cf. discoideum]